MKDISQSYYSVCTRQDSDCEANLPCHFLCFDYDHDDVVVLTSGKRDTILHRQQYVRKRRNRNFPLNVVAARLLIFVQGPATVDTRMDSWGTGKAFEAARERHYSVVVAAIAVAVLANAKDVVDVA